jgi:DNA-binding protein HU-beta
VPESFKPCYVSSFLTDTNVEGQNMAKKAVTAATATPKAATVKAAAPATVTLKHLAAALAEEHELSKKQTEAILGDMVGRITKHLKKGERIRIVGLGILQVKKRAARMGRNPATGEAIQIKASKKVAFRAAKELKEAV